MPRMSSITRRDFLNGAALTIAAGLTPAAQLAAQPNRYPPALMGLRGLGVDIARFETAFERGFYPSLGLSRGTFFNREAFGRDVLVTGDPGSDEDNTRFNAKPLSEFVSAFPVSEASKAQIVALYFG